ncbi:MAG: hypothetical protein OET63_14145 [Desulfobacterales bacterium]|jgi:hypothetical protein|nr:hypothetical protein [Desulfobacterales bacterium]
MKICKHQIFESRFLGGLIAVILLLLQLQGCAEVPITHRKGLHPAPETRIADIKKYLPEALPYYEKSAK